MNNTPETDKAERMEYSQEYMVSAEFARKLERERDEAMEHLSAAKHFLNKYIAERDEAREESEQQARLLGISAEREYALRGKIFELLKKENETIP
jgi:hypothetical protein